MQPQQIDQRLIRRRHRLRQRRREGKTREHLHQIIMRRMQSQRQTLELRNLLARVVIITTFLAACIDARGGTCACERVGEGDVQCGQGGDFVGRACGADGAGRADVGDCVAEGADGLGEDPVGFGYEAGDGHEGDEEGAEAREG